LVDYEALARPGEPLYTLPEMLADLRRSVWTELTTANVRVPLYRRGLQRSYLEAVDRQLNPPPRPAGGPGPQPQQQPGAPPAPTANSDVRPALRGQLMEIDRIAAAALSRTSDAMTELHLRDVRFEIARILDPDRDRRAAR
jgi:hypothetical protein